MRNFSKFILTTSLLTSLPTLAAFRGVTCLTDYRPVDGSRRELELVEQPDGRQTLKQIFTLGGNSPTGPTEPESSETKGLSCENSSVDAIVLYCEGKRTEFQIKLAQSRLGTTVYEAVLKVDGKETMSDTFDYKKPSGPITSYCKLK